ASLEAALDALERAETCPVGRITCGEGKDAALRLRNVAVMLDDGTAVIQSADLAIMSGEKVLLTGESGTGKSTLVRALAGVWPWGKGEIEIATGAKLLILPQRPYVPMGTLRRAVNYPNPAHNRNVKEIANVLEKVELGHLAKRLDEEASWDQILSGGEKQRLAFARVLLHRPDLMEGGTFRGALPEAEALSPRTSEALSIH